jgi:hypothetical protein
MVMGYFNITRNHHDEASGISAPKIRPIIPSTPAKKSTRGPSPRRISETEVAARLEKIGWKIISGFHLLDQPCVMKHRCGLQLSGLTPKSFCYGKKRLCPVCDKLVPSGWVKKHR